MPHRPPPPRRNVAAVLLVGLAASGALATPAAAQTGVGPSKKPIDHSDRDYPPWVGQFTVLSGNVLISGLSAGISQKLRGGSFQDGFTRGALGGAVVYAGKRTAVERFDGAGLIGRQVAAVGTSMVRNAADGLPTFESLLLPFGPVHLYVRPGEDRPIQARVDLANLVWTGWAVAEPRLSFDAGASLSSGAPVFRADELLLSSRWGEGRASGLSAAGTVLASRVEDWGDAHLAATLAHERVHVLQDDFIFYLFSHPLEGWLMQRIPGGGAASRFLDLNLGSNLHGALSYAFRTYQNRPWEMEAQYLERR